VAAANIVRHYHEMIRLEESSLAQPVPH
jgi:hypothetical protein